MNSANCTAPESPTRSATSASRIYRLRVSLVASDPEIWRLIEVSSGLRLDELHAVLQITMGWQNAHLHLFTDRSPYDRGTTPPRTWLDGDSIDEGLDGELETAVTLGEVLTSASGPLFYEYDFGDAWLHIIELIEVVEVSAQDAGAPIATIIRGDRRCPLEDSGGLNGYDEKLAILADPTDESFVFIRDWVSGFRDPWSPTESAPFDPAVFDLAAANAMLDEWTAERARGEVPDAASAGTTLDGIVRRMPPSARSPFRAYVHRNKADRRPGQIETADAPEMVAPYAWLLRRVGLEGMQLSAAGWMPPSVVRDAMRELGWEDRWYGMFNREYQTIPIQNLRASAQQLGLLRKLKGRLVLSVAARKLLDDPQALWNFLARALSLKHPDEASRDATLLLATEIATGAHTQQTEMLEAIAYGMEVLGWHFDARGTPEDAVRELTRPTWHALADLGVLPPFTYPPSTVEVTQRGREFALAILNG